MTDDDSFEGSDDAPDTAPIANKAEPIPARTFTIESDDHGIRLDRWFKRHLPDVPFALVSGGRARGKSASTARASMSAIG